MSLSRPISRLVRPAQNTGSRFFKGINLSLRHRKRIEDVFGWAKTVAGQPEQGSGVLAVSLHLLSLLLRTTIFFDCRSSRLANVMTTWPEQATMDGQKNVPMEPSVSRFVLSRVMKLLSKPSFGLPFQPPASVGPAPVGAGRRLRLADRSARQGYQGGLCFRATSSTVCQADRHS